jgi:hypothetical protein
MAERVLVHLVAVVVRLDSGLRKYCKKKATGLKNKQKENAV